MEKILNILETKSKVTKAEIDDIRKYKSISPNAIKRLYQYVRPAEKADSLVYKFIKNANKENLGKTIIELSKNGYGFSFMDYYIKELKQSWELTNFDVDTQKAIIKAELEYAISYANILLDEQEQFFEYVENGNFEIDDILAECGVSIDKNKSLIDRIHDSIVNELEINIELNEVTYSGKIKFINKNEIFKDDKFKEGIVYLKEKKLEQIITNYLENCGYEPQEIKEMYLFSYLDGAIDNGEYGVCYYSQWQEMTSYEKIDFMNNN